MRLDLAVVVLVALAVQGEIAFWDYRRRRKMRAENAELRAAVEELGNIVEWQHQTIYRLGCQMYGKTATERAMREARERGEN